ncbi:MAG: hypothetical protein PWP45_324 [Tepidanaerobacteraceae bacterium]|nr:hypothetical protein [Tepidanaerobacteraceae bacterium]
MDDKITYFKKKEEFLSRILENEQMLIVVWALDGRVVWLNRYVRIIFGITLEGQTEIIDVTSSP